MKKFENYRNKLDIFLYKILQTIHRKTFPILDIVLKSWEFIKICGSTSNIYRYILNERREKLCRAHIILDIQEIFIANIKGHDTFSKKYRRNTRITIVINSQLFSRKNYLIPRAKKCLAIRRIFS